MPDSPGEQRGTASARSGLPARYVVRSEGHVDPFVFNARLAGSIARGTHFSQTCFNVQCPTRRGNSGGPGRRLGAIVVMTTFECPTRRAKSEGSNACVVAQFSDARCTFNARLAWLKARALESILGRMPAAFQSQTHLAKSEGNCGIDVGIAISRATPVIGFNARLAGPIARAPLDDLVREIRLQLLDPGRCDSMP